MDPSQEAGQEKSPGSAEKAASLSPDNPAILYHLGSVCFETGDKALARANLETALQISQNFEGAEEAKKLLERAKK